MIHLPALVTLLTVLLLFATALQVGRARGRYGIKAPATSGHPAFERAFRVQMNTLEAAVLFLPTLWLAAHYGFSGWAGVAGLVWLVARIWFAFAYLAAAERRGPAFAVSLLAWLVTFVLAAIGVVRAFAIAG